jgi:hypothetical protein
LKWESNFSPNKHQSQISGGHRTSLSPFCLSLGHMQGPRVAWFFLVP